MEIGQSSGVSLLKYVEEDEEEEDETVDDVNLEEI